MKKAIYLFAAAAFMASCNQEVLIDETTNAQPEVNRRIGFDTFVDKATRTTGTNSTELKDFYSTFIVNGWKTVGTETTCVFDNIPVEFFATDTRGEVVYKEEEQKPSDEWNFAANSWYYENVRYWDKMASAYQFSAYTPALADVAVSCAVDGTITIGTATAPVTVDGTNLMETPAEALAYTGFAADYMTATSNDATDKVSLTFNHLQAKMNVRIKLDESITTAQDVSIQKIAIHNLGDKGYYTNEDGIGVSGWTLYTPATPDEKADEPQLVDDVEGDVENSESTPTVVEYVPTVTGPYSLNNATTKYHDFYVLEQLIIPQTIAKYVTPTPESNAPAKRADDENGGSNGEGSNGEGSVEEGSDADDSTEQEPEEQPTTPVVTIPVSLSEYAEACVYVEYTIGAETFKSYSPLANMFIGSGVSTTYDFEGGKQYTLNITVGPKPIEFEAEVAEWETAEADQDMD